MKEVEITGKTIFEIYDKLKTYIGQKICQYHGEDRIEYILIKVIHLYSGYIHIDTDPYGPYSYYYKVASPLFLCIEKEEVEETFEEKMRRKQEEMFHKNCY